MGHTLILHNWKEYIFHQSTLGSGIIPGGKREWEGSTSSLPYTAESIRCASEGTATIAEREALRKGIEHLTVLFPTAVSSFDFQVENSGRTVQYKLNA